MGKKSTIAAIYARVSTQHHGQNPDVQLAELRRFCQARGWSIGHEIVDHGYSGGTAARPGLRRLETLVRSRKVDAVVVVKLDRLFRSLRHLVATLDEYQALGITFVAVMDSIDYSTPSGRFFTQVLGSLAELERSILRERTMMGLDYARASGKRLGRPRSHDPEEIRRLRALGLTYAAIQERLGLSKGTVCRALAGTPKSPSARSPKTSVNSGGADD